MWRYTAIHFQGGTKVPFPERVKYPGAQSTEQEQTAASWETVTVDELVSPEVRALLKG